MNLAHYITYTHRDAPHIRFVHLATDPAPAWAVNFAPAVPSDFGNIDHNAEPKATYVETTYPVKIETLSALRIVQQRLLENKIESALSWLNKVLKDIESSAVSQIKDF